MYIRIIVKRMQLGRKWTCLSSLHRDNYIPNRLRMSGRFVACFNATKLTIPSQPVTEAAIRNPSTIACERNGVQNY